MNNLWLFDSRSRCQVDKRKLYQFPDTMTGKLAAWATVVAAELPESEWADYRSIASIDVENASHEMCFNDYWAEYGWYLMPVGDNATIPADAEIRKA